MDELQRILDALAEGGDLAELLASCNNLDEVMAAAREAFRTLQAAEAYTSDDVAQMRVLASVVEAGTTLAESRAGEAQALADEVAAMATVVVPAQAAAEGDATEGTEGSGDDTDDGGGSQASNDPAPDPEPQVSGQAAVQRARVNLAALAARRNTVPAQQNGGNDGGTQLAVVAAANVPTIPVGTALDLERMGEAIIAQLRTMPTPRRGVGNHRAGVAVIEKAFTSDLVANSESDIDVIERAANQGRLRGGNLIAAGGWCAPSEQVYDLFELEGRDGLLSVPEVNLARGGLRFTVGPDFSSIYTASSAGFISQTEADAIAEEEKPCFEVPCPSFTEVRLGIEGLCIQAGILANAAYPEFTQRYIRGTLTAHAHYLNRKRIADIVTNSTAVTLNSTYWQANDAGPAFLEALELQALDYRLKHRMVEGATLEVIAPRWNKALIRAGLAKRNGLDNPLDVTDAQITTWARQRGVSVQWVIDFQDAFADAGSGLGASAAATAWPATTKFIIYAAGTFVFGTKSVLTIDAGIYDTALLAVNKYQALFTEEGYAILKRGFESRVVTLTWAPNGQTGQQVDMTP